MGSEQALAVDVSVVAIEARQKVAIGLTVRTSQDGRGIASIGNETSLSAELNCSTAETRSSRLKRAMSWRSNSSTSSKP
jgi:hypothetical protein